MDRLWAPWRIKFIQGKKAKGCIFCLAAKFSKKYLVIFRTKYSISLLNAYPYNNGHMMVCPLRHIKSFEELTQVQALDLIKTMEITRKMLDKVLKPHGYNIGLNMGQVAGAGIAGHMHIHIVPRFRGDANFMSAVYDTRVISQSLAELSERLKRVKPKTD